MGAEGVDGVVRTRAGTRELPSGDGRGDPGARPPARARHTQEILLLQRVAGNAATLRLLRDQGPADVVRRAPPGAPVQEGSGPSDDVATYLSTFKGLVGRALDAAIARLDSAFRALDQAVEDGQPQHERWRGPLMRIRAYLSVQRSTDTPLISPDAPGAPATGVIAVTSKSTQSITVKARWFELDVDEQAFALVHEAAHAVNNADDVAYKFERRFPWLDPSTQITNAESHAAAAWGLSGAALAGTPTDVTGAGDVGPDDFALAAHLVEVAGAVCEWATTTGVKALAEARTASLATVPDDGAWPTNLVAFVNGFNGKPTKNPKRRLEDVAAWFTGDVLLRNLTIVHQALNRSPVTVVAPEAGTPAFVRRPEGLTFAFDQAAAADDVAAVWTLEQALRLVINGPEWAKRLAGGLFAAWVEADGQVAASMQGGDPRKAADIDTDADATDH